MNRTLSISPEGRRPVVPRHDVRRGAGRVRRPGARPHRRRRRPPAARDDLRHAQRQGRHRGDRERVRGEGPAPAGLHLGHDHRSQRPHALGPDDRRVLHLHPPRAAARHRHELRARRTRDASAPRGAGAARRVLRALLPERRPAERLRSVRPAARRDGGSPRVVRHRRTREHRRRLLRDDARSHQGDRARDRRPAGAPTTRGFVGPADRRTPSAERRTLHAVLRPRDAHHPSRQQLSDDRRADERHRLGKVRAPHQERRLHRGRAGRGRAGSQRRQHHRRQHGRGHARLRAGDDDVPQLHRDRAGDRARAGDDRQLEVVGARGRAEVRPGQERRQLDQPEGRRGRLPPQGEDRPALRRRRRRDGVRRGRTGGYHRAQGLDLPARLQDPDRAGRVRSDRHHLRSQHPRDRHRPRGAQRLRHQLHRGHAHHQGDVSRA